MEVYVKRMINLLDWGDHTQLDPVNGSHRGPAVQVFKNTNKVTGFFVLSSDAQAFNITVYYNLNDVLAPSYTSFDRITLSYVTIPPT